MNKQTAPLETVLEVAAEMITSREMTVALLVELAEARLQERFLGERINELRAEYNHAVKMADEDEARFERICDEKNREFKALVAAIDAERADYARILAERDETIAELQGRIERLIAQR